MDVVVARGTAMTDVTQILSQIESGDSSAAEQLLPLVYDELRKLAAAKLGREKPGQTLDATALVHEAYLRLVGSVRPQSWDGRSHFFAAAAEAMRRILVENARRKNRIRHGGQMNRVDIDDFPIAVIAPDDDLLAVHETLDALAQTDAQAAELIKLHYFLGLSMDESAQLLGISPRSAYRTWSFARAWIYKHLGRESS
jgi:RNA polymerase sigma factor (TIGR02999 family)